VNSTTGTNDEQITGFRILKSRKYNDPASTETAAIATLCGISSLSETRLVRSARTRVLHVIDEVSPGDSQMSPNGLSNLTIVVVEDHDDARTPDKLSEAILTVLNN
jgi:hypothetical protein